MPDSGQAAFVAALIEQVAKNSENTMCFETVQEAQHLAFRRLQQQVMEIIVNAMVASRGTGHVQLDLAHDPQSLAWLLDAGFRLYLHDAEVVVAWGDHVRPRSWKPLAVAVPQQSSETSPHNSAGFQ